MAEQLRFQGAIAEVFLMNEKKESQVSSFQANALYKNAALYFLTDGKLLSEHNGEFLEINAIDAECEVV